MEVLAWGDAATLNRPCVDCSRVTGCFCDGCFAIQRDPDAYWAPGQHTPLCTACDAKHGECHHCRGLAWVAPRVWGDGATGVGADETDPDPAPPSRAKPAPPRAPSSYGAQPATPPPPPPLSRRPRLSARGGSSPDVHRRVPPKSKRARSQWPRSPRPSSSEADLEAELEEKPSPKPRPRLSQLDPASYELHEEDNYEWWEETMRMQDEDVGIEYEDESRQRLLRGHNTDDTESTA